MIKRGKCGQHSEDRPSLCCNSHAIGAPSARTAGAAAVPAAGSGDGDGDEDEKEEEEEEVPFTVSAGAGGRAPAVPAAPEFKSGWKGTEDRSAFDSFVTRFSESAAASDASRDTLIPIAAPLDVWRDASHSRCEKSGLRFLNMRFSAMHCASSASSTTSFFFFFFTAAASFGINYHRSPHQKERHVSNRVKR